MTPEILHEEKTANGYIIKIYPDYDSQESPDDYGDDYAYLVADNREMTTTAKHPDDPEKYHAYPVEAYIHSGISLSLQDTGNYPDRKWDVSNNFATLYVTKEDKDPETTARNLLKIWNACLSGQVYGYTIEDEDGEIHGSCWGFIETGYDIEKSDVLKEARAEAKSLPPTKNNKKIIAQKIQQGTNQIADTLATYSTDKEYNTAILRNVKSILTIARKATK